LSESTAILVFSKCRNESLRLPAFLRHYRNLGVDQFFIVDNASTDGTTEYLLEQPDTRVFRTTQPFREAQGGTAWLNALLSEFGVGRWCVPVDIDELLVFPGSEVSSLRVLTDYFDRRSYQALACMLLDMYPDGPLNQVAYRPGDDLLDVAFYFDPAPYTRSTASQCPWFLLVGGVRERVFYPELRTATFRATIGAFIFRHVGTHIPWFRNLAWVRRFRPRLPPCLTKVPLVKWDSNTAYLNVNHFITDRVLAPEQGVLLHFKFLQDFHDKALREVQRAEYFEGASEYKRYAARLIAEPNLILRDRNSVRFEGTDQLESFSLMVDSPEWRSARLA
jgi:glycosyltransferase involved in cell wall biosynthesis